MMKNTHTAMLKHSHHHASKEIEVRETKLYYVWDKRKFTKKQLVEVGSPWMFYYIENLKPIKAV